MDRTILRFAYARVSNCKFGKRREVSWRREVESISVVMAAPKFVRTEEIELFGRRCDFSLAIISLRHNAIYRAEILENARYENNNAGIKISCVIKILLG